MFDRIAVPNISAAFSNIKFDHKERGGAYISELEWLIDEGVVFEPSLLEPDESLLSDPQYRSFQQSFEEAVAESQKASIKYLNKVKGAEIVGLPPPPITKQFLDAELRNMEIVDEALARQIAAQMRAMLNVDANYLADRQPVITSNSQARPAVISVVIKTLPVPSEDIPWEHILEFRKDPDSKSKFLDLRNWMNETARGDLSAIEVEQKLEYLISQYQRHMAIHKMKTNVGTLETLVTSGAEVIENLTKFNFGKMAKMFFSFKQRQVALLQADLESPGSEVAYIVKSRASFTS